MLRQPWDVHQALTYQKRPPQQSWISRLQKMHHLSVKFNTAEQERNMVQQAVPSIAFDPASSNQKPRSVSAQSPWTETPSRLNLTRDGPNMEPTNNQLTLMSEESIPSELLDHYSYEQRANGSQSGRSHPRRRDPHCETGHQLAATKHPNPSPCGWYK